MRIPLRTTEIEHVGHEMQFGCHLDRAPKRVSGYIDGLVRGFYLRRSELETALRARHLRVGASPDTWRRQWPARQPPPASLVDDW